MRSCTRPVDIHGVGEDAEGEKAVIRSAVLGCGGRSVAHYRAYEGLESMRVVAACDMQEDRLREKGEQYQIPKLYTDLEDMLSREQPDLLHIVTPPAVREGPMELAGRAGVKGIIVEKPIALDVPQARRIAAVAEQFGLKVAVNTQRRYFPSCQHLASLLRDGRIGDILFIRCATRGNILSMGPHIVDLLQLFLDDITPDAVWACADGMNGYEYGHPAPARILARYAYPNGVTAYLEDADDAVCTPNETAFWQHLRLDVWGTEGRAWYAQNTDWGYHVHGEASPFVETVTWTGEDACGQRCFTQAMGEWLLDDAKTHGNCLTNNLIQFQIIMATLLSVHVRRPVQLNEEIPPDIVATVEQELG